MTTLINFLHGAGPNNNGQWFDEVAETTRGAFWWREYLREIERLSSDRIEELEAELARAVKVMSQAHVLMRECGWQLAPQSEPNGDGVLEIAVADTERKFAAIIEELKGGEANRGAE
jgi:hypothetical protein